MCHWRLARQCCEHPQLRRRVSRRRHPRAPPRDRRHAGRIVLTSRFFRRLRMVRRYSATLPSQPRRPPRRAGPVPAQRRARPAPAESSRSMELLFGRRTGLLRVPQRACPAVHPTPARPAQGDACPAARSNRAPRSLRLAALPPALPRRPLGRLAAYRQSVLPGRSVIAREAAAAPSTTSSSSPPR